jgi:hypothetical protein
MFFSKGSEPYAAGLSRLVGSMKFCSMGPNPDHTHDERMSPIGPLWPTAALRLGRAALDFPFIFLFLKIRQQQNYA